MERLFKTCGYQPRTHHQLPHLVVQLLSQTLLFPATDLRQLFFKSLSFAHVPCNTFDANHPVGLTLEILHCKFAPAVISVPRDVF